MIKITLPNGITIESFDRNKEVGIESISSNIANAAKKVLDITVKKANEVKNKVNKIVKSHQPDTSGDFYKNPPNKSSNSFKELLNQQNNKQQQGKPSNTTPPKPTVPPETHPAPKQPNPNPQKTKPLLDNSSTIRNKLDQVRGKAELNKINQDIEKTQKFTSSEPLRRPTDIKI